MIKNERQYRITRTQARKFREALRTLEDRKDHSMPEILHRAQIDAIRSQPRDLADRLGLREQQIQRYAATNHATADLHRIGEVIDALAIEISERVVLPGRVTQRE